MFLTAMAKSGRITVVHPGDEPVGWRQALEEDVALREAAHRLEMAAPAPMLHGGAAVWAAERLYRCCQFLIYRDLDADSVERVLGSGPDFQADVSTCYSVDIAFCHLPDVYRLARGIAADDPLVVALRKLAQEWPLSSVGISDIGLVDSGAFIGDACLRDMYVTRIIRRRDRARLAEPEVQEAVRKAVGAYPNLAGELLNTFAKESAA